MDTYFKRKILARMDTYFKRTELFKLWTDSIDHEHEHKEKNSSVLTYSLNWTVQPGTTLSDSKETDFLA